jgi:hypothetical protein
MKIKDFSTFVSHKINENSDLDWSDKNWGEAGIDGENPPNSGLEGTSAEPMDYTAGDYGETSEEDVILDDEIKSTGDGLDLENIKALITDLSERISKIEKSKK